MKRLLRFFIWISVILLVLVIGGWYLTTDSEATVTESNLQGLNDAESVNELLQQLQASVVDRHQPHTIRLNRVQIDSLVAFIERAKPALKGRVKLSKHLSTLQLSYRVQTAWSTRYFNLSVGLLPGDSLTLDRVKVGEIHLPGTWVLGMATWLVDWWTDSDIATYATQQVNNVAMSQDNLAISLEPLDGLLRALNTISNGLNIDQDEWLSQRTAHYIRFLYRYATNRPDIYNDPQPSLAIYLQAVMREAQRASERGPVEENEAALLALTIFAGHHRFANLVGDVQSDPDKAARPPNPTVLAQRQDLSLHFIISAGLKLLSEQGISAAIGEFKELMDRVLGGSGYSFVDLAADMAGVKLAVAAIDPDRAADIQQRLAAGITEADFFPSIIGLPEGLDKQSFTERFGNVDSDAYQQQVTEIQRRLEQLPLYQ
ncbi:hypothetical protein QTP81_13960 [Alteromonas sp. ASW11-36]|uniref:Secreted protein n=1 Tax=Alteromonas arenosi TaxID=3055817 RepID=A0ABT7SZT8_9ALTE|nr:hypothetical protein [Alteromonas sp. ASW11-36]MDM7861702.1 hypothetical protein [Alteromonas sp. ASW11-36]